MFKKDERLLCQGLNKGPGLGMIRKALDQTLEGHPHPKLHMFGNGYRECPINITGIEVVRGSKKDLVLNIFGKTNYRDHTPSIQGTKIVIQNYNPQLRIGDGIRMVP